MFCKKKLAENKLNLGWWNPIYYKHQSRHTIYPHKQINIQEKLNRNKKKQKNYNLSTDNHIATYEHECFLSVQPSINMRFTNIVYVEYTSFRRLHQLFNLPKWTYLFLSLCIKLFMKWFLDFTIFYRLLTGHKKKVNEYY